MIVVIGIVEIELGDDVQLMQCHIGVGVRRRYWE